MLSIAVLRSGSVLRSTETGTFADAEAVAYSLRGRFGSGDAVVTTLPTSLPELQYYFPRAGLSIDALVRPPEQARHVYVVAPLGSLPVIAGWPTGTQIERFGGSSLFVLER